MTSFSRAELHKFFLGGGEIFYEEEDNRVYTMQIQCRSGRHIKSRLDEQVSTYPGSTRDVRIKAERG